MEAEEKVKTIKEKLRAAQSRQKHYADRRRRPLEFQVGDHVYLKVSPFKGTQRFQEKGKLAPRYIGLFQILAKRGAMAYQLELPPSLSSIHDVFHVSQLKKCLRIPIEMVNIEELDIQPNLSYKEHPIKILDWDEKKIKNKTIKFVKVQRSHHSDREATWELEDRLKKSYPNLFCG